MRASTREHADHTRPDGVPQQLVHKTDSGEVYLRKWHRTGPDAFRITARWPERHAFYRTERPCDPLLLCETIRQTFPLLSHAAYEVPMGFQLIWERFAYRIEADAHARPDHGLGPDVVLDAECYDITYRGTRPAALSMRLRISRDGVLVATADTRFAVQAQNAYRRLRGLAVDPARAMAEAPPDAVPVDHRLTGRTRPDDVVLAPAADGTDMSWRLRVDTTHPTLFDHAVDHVPGMLLLEAAHQTARDTAGDGPADILGLDCEFYRYVELGSACTVSATATAPGTAPTRQSRVTAEQDGQVRFSATVTYADARHLSGTGCPAH